MKNNLIRFFILTFFVLTDFIAFSQNDEDDNGDLEGNDPPPVPVNSKLIYLVIMGIIFAYYSYKKSRKTT